MNGTASPAKRGDAITIYATGSGLWSVPWPAGQIMVLPQGLPFSSGTNAFPVVPRAGVSVTIGGKAAQLLYAGGAPELAGVLQINAVVSNDVPSGPQPVEVKVGGVSNSPDQSVTVVIQ